MRRCKVCDKGHQPLMRLCDCGGLDSLMHHECAVFFIARRIEQAQTMMIPFCEFCMTPFSARLVRGDIRINLRMLFENLIRLELRVILLCIFYFFGGFFAIWLPVKAVVIFFRMHFRGGIA